MDLVLEGSCGCCGGGGGGRGRLSSSWLLLDLDQPYSFLSRFWKQFWNQQKQEVPQTISFWELTRRLPKHGTC